jgi:ankyrin repeat domain-containing protein 50
MRKQLQSICQVTRLKGSHLDWEVCKQQLLESVNLYSNTTIVLDALDECEKSSRYRLIEAFDFVISQSKRPVRVFISSRPDRDIRRQFQTKRNIEILAKDNSEDIKKFVQKEIVKHEEWHDLSQSLKDEIVKKLFDQSQGM